MSLKDYQVIKKVGDGSYSMVFEVKRLADNNNYALKKVKLASLKDKEKRNALNEIRILASIHHPNVISYKEAFFDEDGQSLCLVMEYADSGDLQQRIKTYQKKGKYMSEKFIWSLIVQLCCGLKVLHELNIVHRDIKSANVFLHSDNKIKIGDMNVSKVVKGCLEHTQTGTPYYASPEVWKDLPYDYRSDLWSLGCVIYEAVCLKPPFNAEDMQSLYKKVIKGDYPPLPRTFSKELHSIVASLINVNPSNRPTCSQILALPSVSRHFDESFSQPTENLLLKTINFPQTNPKMFEILPKSKFEESKTPEIPKNNFEDSKGNNKSSLNLPVMNKSRDSSVPVQRSFKERECSEKSLQNIQRYRKMVLKKDFGALKLPKVNSYLKSVGRNLQVKEFTIAPRIKSEKFSRKPNTNRSLIKLC
jgi:NIMA (never in mitosis gene a)-related kinase